MLRQGLKKQHMGAAYGFRNRGEHCSRIEAISDGVFALAITLILISAQAPQSFQQMQQFLHEIIPFLFCIGLITLIWYQHYKFFLRYGFRNAYIIFLNTLLLATVLFYVYPLRFLSKLLLMMFLTEDRNSMREMIGPDEMPWLMVLYGAGVALIFIIFSLMYYYALLQADKIALNAVERFDTRASIVENVIMAAVPLLSMAIALAFRDKDWGSGAAGFTYFLYSPLMFIYGYKVSRYREELLKHPEDDEPTSSHVSVTHS